MNVTTRRSLLPSGRLRLLPDGLGYLSSYLSGISHGSRLTGFAMTVTDPGRPAGTSSKTFSGRPGKSWRPSISGLTGPKIKEELISALRNPVAIRDQPGRLQRTAESDPALAIGTAKELIGSTAKTVLQERGLEVNDKDDLPALVKQAQEALGLHPSSAQPGPDSTDAVKRILGGLMNVTAGLGELRNRGYGTGHGHKGERVGLRPRHARLAVNAVMTWCSVMLDTLAPSSATASSDRWPPPTSRKPRPNYAGRSA